MICGWIRTKHGGVAPKRSQSGASLLFVLMLITMGGIIMVALAAYTSSSARVTRNFTEIRTDRYAADGAIKTAINWIKDQPTVAVDPLYNPASADACRFETNEVTVTCETPEGSGSGVPPEQGALPPETVLLLGSRHTEPGPYSYSNCASVWDSISNFFTGFTPGEAEFSFTAQKSKRSSGWLNLGSCVDRNRGNGPVKILGNMVAAGKIQAKSGISVSASGPNGTAGTIRAKYGCVNISCQAWVNNRSAPGKPWDGTAAESDPGRTTTNALTPFGDIRSEFLPIGFQSDGSLRAGYSLPERTKAYVYDKSQNPSGSSTVPQFLKTIDSCADAPSGSPIIFLPGWYKRSEILSQYTGAVNSCTDRTFWFPPNAGPDFKLLTDDDETGAYYLDFGGSASTDGRACGVMPKPNPMTSAVAARWCMGGSGDSMYNTKPRVVVGWPSGWEPFPASGSAAPGTPAYGTPIPLELNKAANVAGNFLTYWTNEEDADEIDGQYATYKPCGWWIFTCPSFGQRTLRVEDFSPKVTGAPIAEAGAPNGRINVEVRYGLQFGSAMGTPWLDADVLDRDGVAVSCGSYQMINNSTVDFDGSGSLPASKKYVFDATQAKTLADSCGSVEKINNLRFSLRIGGNILNNPASKVFFDGVKITYNTYQGASFPVGTDNTYNSTKPAKSDCDVTKPGAQLIFGGESSVYVADGSLEVCGGPDPDNPMNAQVIGVYGVPALRSLNPSTIAGAGGDNVELVGNLDSVKTIGEPGGLDYLTIKYGQRGTLNNNEGKVSAKFDAITIPAGYVVDKVELRASYNSKNPGDWLGIGSNAEISVKKKDNTWCDRIKFTLTGDMVQAANVRKSGFNLLLFDSSNPTASCMYDSANPTNPIAFQREFHWVANGWYVWPAGKFEDILEGLELDVTLKPASSTVARLRPQSGCIIAHPNYTGGESTPDCALIRAESFDSADAAEGTPVRGKWVGRVSVKGTIYAPSSAVEIDDNDVAYPLATRGVILRHLRISGAKSRSGYTAPWFGGDIDTDPVARTAVLTACRQSEALKQSTPLANRLPCGENAGDVILAKAGVRFLTPQIVGQANQANAPVVEWWSDRRTAGAS